MTRNLVAQMIVFVGQEIGSAEKGGEGGKGEAHMSLKVSSEESEYV